MTPDSTRPATADDIVPVWEEPPPAALVAAGIDWMAMLATLNARPGKWARLRTYPKSHTSSSTAGTIRKRLRDAGVTDYEVISRKLDDGTGGVYARYIGGAK